MSKDLKAQIYFDLDGICGLKVYGEPGLVSGVAQELAFYQVPLGSGLMPLDLEFELNYLSRYQRTSNPPSLPPYDFPGQHKLAKWIIRFERVSQKPYRIRIYGNFLSKLIISKQILEPAIQMIAQSLGFIFVHSTTLVKEERGVMVAGAGGMGKTRLLLQWLKRGHPFLSDDFTILSYGKARRYITRLRLGARLLRESGLSQSLGLKRQLEIYARTGLRRLLFNYAKFQAKLGLKELFPELHPLDQVDLKAVVAMEEISEQRPEGVSLQPISSEEMVKKLLEINQREMYGFPRYLSSLYEKTGDKIFSDFFQVQKERLSAYLKEVPCYKIKPVRELKLSELQVLLEQINELF